MGRAAWLYTPEARRGTIGASVAWAQRRDVDSVHVIVDDFDPLAAYAAAGFAAPSVRVWVAEDRSIRPAEPDAPVVPEPPDCPQQLDLLRSFDLEVVADHGVWLSEINGLEVARVGLAPDGTCAIDIGVGAYDQFSAAAIAASDHRSTLAEVVGLVRPHRRLGAPPHAMGRLVRARWLRAQALREPAVIGLDELRAIPLLIARPGLMEGQPAAAIGRRADRSVLVVFSVGLVLEVAETAAGLARYHTPEEVLVVVPERDRHPRLVASASALRAPSSVSTLEGEWRD